MTLTDDDLAWLMEAWERLPEEEKAQIRAAVDALDADEQASSTPEAPAPEAPCTN